MKMTGHRFASKHVAPFTLRNQVWVSTLRSAPAFASFPSLSLLHLWWCPIMSEWNTRGWRLRHCGNHRWSYELKKKERKKYEARTGLSISLSLFLDHTLISSHLTHSLTHALSHTHTGPSLSPFLSSQWGKKESNVHASKPTESSHWVEDFFIPSTPSLSLSLSITFHQFVLLVISLISVSATKLMGGRGASTR